ncbi:hypothetical protein Pth03_51760 [Planotetraspora thailandica]|uniref:Uncharacterized protein n=1 Tax=Planotetraspora thailandica TaxID=487172 RepID=A0A8J3V7A8_9ACTN|nr:hypothetical protein [Planotetraspora thailandica]GII56787.1 hypothetical protein Pth03_51760 [Planotetraspora thailandica]
MARRLGVFVRPLTMEDCRKLQRITRAAKDPVKLRRADRGDDVRPGPKRSGHHLPAAQAVTSVDLSSFWTTHRIDG